MISDKEITVYERSQGKSPKMFTFDGVFGPSSTQVDVYDTVVSPLLKKVIAGYSCTVFAYGQTGTGKTYTMEGDHANNPNLHWQSDTSAGMIPRCLSHLFDENQQLQLVKEVAHTTGYHAGGRVALPMQIRIVRVITLHRVRFAGAGLAVGKHGATIPGDDFLQQRADHRVLNGVWASSLLLSLTPQLFVTSPTTTIRATPVPPNAPIKLRKPFSKEGLKPKKLRFTDKDKDGTEDENYSKKSADFFIKMSKQKAEFPKRQGKSKARLDCDMQDSLSAMLQNVRFELDNKKNMRYGQGQYEKRARNNKDSSQSSKLNCSPKGSVSKGVLPYCRHVKIHGVKRRNYHGYNHEETWVDGFSAVGKTARNGDTVMISMTLWMYQRLDLIENKYNAGSLVWGLVDGYPWWPAIVDDWIETLQFYELEESSIIPVKYHVTFFKDNLHCEWLNRKTIKPFIKYKKSTLVRKQNKFNEINHKKSLEKAYALAQSAIPLSISERLQRFSSFSRIRNLQGSVIQSYEEQDDEISSTPTESTEHITLKEFYLKNKHYTKNKFL
ncbi:Zinc finger CW-type PWWP domain protein 1 [Temnothorax longispinosus]|uniref:Zinc finger CW-type PWWP domain protein 1 n=1 Tax=Temnothorax longispinosus TaxID=300112 RepID=A0A4S2JBB6_9HYME|nr:Zinc finger CW-type PWWP domain protein 1 [Temnothorax longispinosus]